MLPMWLRVAVCVYTGCCATALASDLADVPGAELIEKLNARETRVAAFAELRRRTEADKRDLARNYLNPEVVVCPQRTGPPLYIVLCDSAYEPDSDENYKVRDPESLFRPELGPVNPSPPAEKWRQGRVIFGFTEDGAAFQPFGGWNLLDGHLFDLNGDGLIERIETQNYGTDLEEESVQLLRVHRVERPAVSLLTVAINRGRGDEWGWAIHKEEDGRWAILIGPKESAARPRSGNGPDWRLRSVAAVFRWNEQRDRYDGPAGSAEEHFFLIDKEDDWAAAMARIRAAPPFPPNPHMPNAIAPPSPVATPAEKWQYVSLRDKSNEELVLTIQGGKDQHEAERDARVKTNVPERFWEMPPKEAALALVDANRSPESRRACYLAVDDRDGAVPPNSGEIGLEWKDSGCMIAPGAGRAKLDYTPGSSQCSLARVTIRSRIVPAMLAQALAGTRTATVPDDLARHVYETVWWLGRVRTLCSDSAARYVSTGDGSLKFWQTPEVESGVDATMFSDSLSERWTSGYDRETHANFALLVVRELQTAKLRLLDPQEEPPVIGSPREYTPDEDFVYNDKPPDINDPAAVERYVTRLLQIMESDAARIPRYYPVGNLVPTEEPLRYRDPRIDEALFEMARAAANSRVQGKPRQHVFGDGCWAAHALAQRGRSEAFELLMQMLQQPVESHSKDRALEGAALLASHHKQFRHFFHEYVAAELRRIHDTRLGTRELFDAVLKCHLTELTPLLEEMSTASVDEIATRRSSGSGAAFDPAASRFHEARRILTIWREEDALTQLKLIAVLDAAKRHVEPLAETLRTSYAALPPPERRAFSEFLAWFKEREERRQPVYHDRVVRIGRMQTAME